MKKCDFCGGYFDESELGLHLVTWHQIVIQHSSSLELLAQAVLEGRVGIGGVGRIIVTPKDSNEGDE
jgi:hypothetical protein